MEPKLVLVVDDDADHRAIYGDLLWYNGFDVIFADTAERGYWLAREGAPDLVVLDLGLPDEDGLALCRRLKAENGTAEIPVMVLSARPEAEFGSAASHCGCSLYMEKPTQPVRVLEEVERLIGRAPGGGTPIPNRRTPHPARDPLPAAPAGPTAPGNAPVVAPPALPALEVQVAPIAAEAIGGLAPLGTSPPSGEPPAPPTETPLTPGS